MGKFKKPPSFMKRTLGKLLGTGSSGSTHPYTAANRRVQSKRPTQKSLRGKK